MARRRRTYRRSTSTKTHAKNAMMGVGAAALLGEGTIGALIGYLLGGPVGAIGGFLGPEGLGGLTEGGIQKIGGKVYT